MALSHFRSHIQLNQHGDQIHTNDYAHLNDPKKRKLNGSIGKNKQHCDGFNIDLSDNSSNQDLIDVKYLNLHDIKSEENFDKKCDEIEKYDFKPIVAKAEDIEIIEIEDETVEDDDKYVNPNRVEFSISIPDITNTSSSGEIMIKCVHCQKQFTRSDNLLAHLEQHKQSAGKGHRRELLWCNIFD